VAHPDPIPSAVPPLPTAVAEGRPKLLFLVTEDWYFCSHRLPVARAARDAGIEVVVATRVREHGAQICEEGFGLRSIPWRRRGDGLLGASVMGLGSGFTATTAAARLLRPSLSLALRLATGSARDWVVVQNPEDRAALVALGIDPARIALIRGSGVDIHHFGPLPEPDGGTVTVALVSRMLRDKGVLEAAAAIRRLRLRGLDIELLLAGPTDPDNANSLTAHELRSLAAEPGIEWLGAVADVRTVWRRAVIAVLPSTYGEGVPKALLEAAACGRPLIAADVPGCREAIRRGETGLLVPPHDVVALAEAIAALAADPQRRARMGRAGRALTERQFADEIVARETLALYRAGLQARAARK
jgi:glycosyltransferase involved in cell wall biosynthesis